MILRVLALIAVCLSSSLLVAQATFEGKPLRKIEFVPEEQPLVPSELVRQIALPLDEPLSASAVSAAIERLYASGRFEDIVVEAGLEGDGVGLTFKTTPAWFVGRVSVTGVPEPPNPGQLVNATSLNLGERFVPEDKDRAVENLVDILRSNGFYGAKVSANLDRQERYEQIDFRFDVDPGPRARFTVPVFSGELLARPEKLLRTTRWRGFLIRYGHFAPFTSARAQVGLERLRRYYRGKEYLTSRITLTKLDFDAATNRVTPYVALEKGPKIQIRPEGARLSQRRLKQLVPVYQELAVDRTLLAEGARNIEQHFQVMGYFDTQVDFEFGKVENNQQLINYAIERGERSKLVQIAFRGNTYFDETTLRERMYIRVASLLQFRHGRMSEGLLRRDREAIAGLYRSNGFRDVEVTSELMIGYGGKPGHVGVTFTIEEGPQWFVTGTELSGVNLQYYEHLLSVVQSTPGQPYSDLSVAADRYTILNYYFDAGYPDATLEFSTKPGATPNTVAVQFAVTEGPRRFVKNIVVGGLAKTRQSLVDRRITLKPGDPLSLTELSMNQRALNDLGIFAKVETVIQNPEGRERTKTLLYEFEEARRYSVEFGFGAAIGQIGASSSSYLNPAGSAGFSPRFSVGVNRGNMFGVGHSASLNTRISNIEQRAVLSYLAPQFRSNPNWSVIFSGTYDRSKNVNTYTSEREEASVQLAQKLTKATSLQYRLAWEHVTLGEIKIDPALIPLYARPVRVGTIGVSHVFDRRDDPVDTRRGLLNTLDLSLATRVLGSQPTYTRVVWRNTTYHPVSKQVVFARSLTFAWINGFGAYSHPESIPLPVRLLGGGASSHRGFPENQAGPRDPYSGFPVGGSATLFHNLELRFPLIGENLGGVIFHDAGNVYRSVSDISFRYTQPSGKLPQSGGAAPLTVYGYQYMVQTIGFGVRYRTPIGPLRLDLGFTPNKTNFRGYAGTYEDIISGRGRITDQHIGIMQFHFSIGQTF